MAQDLVYELELKLDQAERQLRSLDTKVEKNAKQTGKIAGNNFGSAMASAIGAILAKISFDSVVAQAKGFIDVASTVEEQMADVQKTTGLAGDELDNLGNDLANLSKDTRTSGEDLRKIAENTGRLGIQGRDNILAFTESVNTLTVALGDEFAGGADQVSSELGVLSNILQGIPAEDRAEQLLRVGNALNVLGAETAASAPVISDFANRIGGLAPKLGADNILGLSAALQELGVTAERGGSAVGRTVNQIGTLLADPTKAQTLAKYIGISVKELTNLFNQNPNEAFLRLSQSLGDGSLNSVELANALDQLGLKGTGTSEVIQKVGSNINLVRKNQDKANKALQNADSITDEYNIKNKTALANQEKFNNQMQVLRTTIGNALLPAFNQLLKAITPVVEKLTTFFSENPNIATGVLVTAGAITALGTAILGLFSAFSFLTPVLTSVGAFFGVGGAGAGGLAGAIALLTGPIGWIIGAFTLITTLLIGLWTQSEQFRNIVSGAFTVIVGILQETVIPAWNFLVAVIMNDLMPVLQELWSMVQGPVITQLKVLGIVIGTVIVGAVVILIAIVTALITVFALLVKGFSKVAEVGNRVLKPVVDFFNDMFNAVDRLIGKVSELAGQLSSLSPGQALDSIRSALGFEQGGIVPGSSYTGDRIRANVNSGEMILTRGQQGALFGLLKGMASGNTTNNNTNNYYGIDFGNRFNNPNFI